jgi:hypothetical protein
MGEAISWRTVQGFAFDVPHGAFVGASCIRRTCSSLAQAGNSSDATRASIAGRRDAITSAPWAAGTAETR